LNALKLRAAGYVWKRSVFQRPRHLPVPGFLLTGLRIDHSHIDPVVESSVLIAEKNIYMGRLYARVFGDFPC
jgi:hypothetical protein